MRLWLLTFNINFQSGFELHCEVVFPDSYLFQPAFHQGFIKFSKVGTLLLDEILQVVDSGNLCISGGGINGTLLALFAELENFVGNLIVGVLVVSLFEKFFLKFPQLFINSVSGGFLGIPDDLCNVLL